ncbi:MULTISPECIES: MogA/MoaB family molybdenum cofactor biosynthesis protein [Staphylococcus]|jgi:molybdenum cofactor biosynthesis protein B|uniref:Molybdenum cofactor biosynthesis protein B n=1 Tax=Staphylococcus equorum TaxID=246432 RepID=A0AAP7LT25_9STAP|nr:molybdenum cofactor biosynthesis protein B [Staphylococcus equorum]ANR68758.1 molybdenum cofactor biosynthesis protein B [Staphylococcus equorum]ERH36241.1 molybdenum cofactor biosynthesis protein B [Staphylococcus equorum UMC-CNS-924]MCE5007450.1 molybdenum cofactor biosynthesis protein MoaB [Staphylococcus equorum]MCE5046622.1 molybdenum cofactor biosynthesis protein MoaB [Staphylococcus equorum]MCM3073314.1 molybdenum cofactor biosynthesis protein MoaB [Staphylococcus equorum]
MHTNVKLNQDIKCAVLTVSDTRDYKTDKGGKLVIELLSELNVSIDKSHYKIVKDEQEAIQMQVEQWLSEDIDVIVTTGGTGIAQRDVTIEAVSSFFTKEIEGFGELFRYLSYAEDVGTRALLSRAIAGTVNEKLIFSIPGSTGAVKLALEKLIKPELNHLVKEITK